MNIHPRKAPPKKSKRIASSISGVIDSQGKVIDNPGTTADTVLTLSGIGTANSVVYIFDNGGLLTTASVTINGTWRFTQTVVLGPHAFTVRDGLGGVDSPAWVVDVGEAFVTPQITRVEDGGGNLIPPDGSTEDNSTIAIYGTASPNQQVELFDYAATVAVVPVDINGDWVFQASEVGAKTYSIAAKGLYGSFPASPAWVFTVEVASDPIAITSIKDAIGVEVPPEGTTSSLSLTLVGTAVAGEGVQILDGDNVLDTKTVSLEGIWTSSLPGLALKKYNLKARGLYGSHPESPVWELTIVAGSGEEDFESESNRIVIEPYTCASGLIVRSVSPGVNIVKSGASYPNLDGGWWGLYAMAITPYEELTLPVAAREIYLAWSFSSPSDRNGRVDISYFNMAGEVVGTQRYTFDSFSLKNTKFTAPASQYISSLTVSLSGLSHYGIGVYSIRWGV